MFGGLTFMIGGNMCCGVNGNKLIVRLDPDHAVRVRSLTVLTLTVIPSRAQREPAPVKRIATCRAPSTAAVNDANDPRREARFAHSLARGLAGRNPGVALPALCDLPGIQALPRR